VRGLGWAFRLLLGQAGRGTAEPQEAPAAQPSQDLDGMLRCLLEMGPVARFEYLKHGFHTHQPQELRGFVNLISAITRFYNQNLSSDDGIDFDDYPIPIPWAPTRQRKARIRRSPRPYCDRRRRRWPGAQAGPAATADSPASAPADPRPVEPFVSAAASVGPAGSVSPRPASTTAGPAPSPPPQRPRGRGS
jgi:hypothetical protein